MNLQELSIDNLKAEVADNLRLRLGLWLSLAIFLTWVSLVWSDINAELYQSLRALQQDSLTLQDIENAEVWTKRFEQSSKRLTQVRSQLWTADSESLARAKLQSELSSLAQPAGAVGASVKVGSAQPFLENEDVSMVRARVGVVLPPEAMYQLLERLEQSDRLMVVEQLNVKLSRGNWSVELMISAYFSSSDWSK